jgi:5-methylcytosine-specific restriction endonuclease McrA
MRRQPTIPLYKTKAWQAFRQVIIMQRPICEGCQREPSRVVHHIKQAKLYPELQFRDDNVQALCDGCHNRESQRESIAARNLPRTSLND